MSLTMVGCQNIPNPFAVDLIIDNIAKYLDNGELKNCRLLNHQWKNLVDKQFLSRCLPLKLVGLTNEQAERNQLSFSSFNELTKVKNSCDPLAPLLRRYQNFILSDSQMGPLTSELSEFWLNFGKQIKILHVHSAAVIGDWKDLMHILLCQHTPALTRLCICLFDDGWDLVPPENFEEVVLSGKENKSLREIKLGKVKTAMTTPDIEYISWKNVLALYPNLTSMLLFNWSPADIKKVITAIVEIRKTGKKMLDLKKLSLYGGQYHCPSWENIETGISCCEKMTTLLAAASLELQNVRLDDSSCLINLALVENQCKSLKSLQFQSMYSNHVYPLMPCLENLSIDATFNFSFLDKAPNLACLTLGPPNFNTLQIMWPKNKSITPISSLEVFKSKSFHWRLADLEPLFKWMPNLTALEMFLNNEEFSCVCKQLINLRSLTVYGDDLTDSGVIGAEYVDGFVPGITNLKGLQRFEMTQLFWKAGLTEKSFDVFLLLENLCELVICMRTELKPDVLSSLANKGVFLKIEVKK